MKNYRQVIFVKRENVVDTMEVLINLGIKKSEQNFFTEGVWRVTFKSTDELFDDVLRNLSEMKVEVLPPQFKGV